MRFLHLGVAHLQRTFSWIGASDVGIGCCSAKPVSSSLTCLDKNTTADSTVVGLTVNNPRIDECHIQNIVKDLNWPSETCCLGGI